MNFSPRLLLCLWVAAATVGPVSASTTSQLTQHGITWNFAAPVEFGKFVTGDYYVIDPGGGVTVSSVTPRPETGRNGSMLNPEPAVSWGSPKSQGYDSRIANYSDQARVPFPAKLPAGSSLVSTISLTTADLDSGGTRYTASWQSASKVGSSHVALKTAAVLTVVANRPPTGSFRPPFVGRTKPLYNVSQIQSRFLPALDPPTAAPSRAISHFERGLERPWLMHGYDWQGRMMHPLENMLNYHQQIGEFLSEASMVLVTKLATETLRNRFIQSGIDTYHTMILGVGDSAFFEWHVIYTGLLLGDAAMANAIKSGVKTQGRASEKFYFWGTKSSTVPRSPGVVEGKTWSGANVFFRKQYGIEEHEHLHPSQWALATTSSIATNGGVKAEKYRQANDSHPHMGMFLASRILGGQSYWRTGAPDAYLERWMTEDWSARAATINQYWSGVPNNTRNMGSSFMNEMWNRYRNHKSGGAGGIVQPPAGQVDKPQPSPAAGVFASARTVTLGSATQGAKINYSLDGSEPTASSATYSSPIHITATTHLRAVAVAPNMVDSDQFSGHYVIDPGLPAVSSHTGWGNHRYTAPEPYGVAPHNDRFTFRLVITPLASNMDGVVGLAEGTVSATDGAFSRLVTTVRFNTNGTIDARDGSVYKADAAIVYQPGRPYQVQMHVNMKTRTYDVVVDGVNLASGYRFRTGQEGAKSLDHFAYFSSFNDKPMAVRTTSRFPARP